MALDTAAPLARLVTVLEGLPGIGAGSVYTGVPESIGPRVAAYVALGGQRFDTETTNTLQREATYFVGFAYAVEGSEATAETTIAGLLDAFQAALLTERETGMGGLVDSVGWEFSLGDGPEYTPVAGSEFRLYPVLVRVTQHTTYG